MVSFLKSSVKKILQRIPGTPYYRHPENSFGQSETSKCRGRLGKFCEGYGVDLGFGGDEIVEHAIRVDLPSPYTKVGAHSVQLGGSASHLFWFRDEVLDFIFSSHLLEDFTDTEATLREWLRVLKPGGKLILFCPDEQRFRKHCAITGQPLNPAHKHEFFSLNLVEEILKKIGETKIVYRSEVENIYSWDLVCEKLPR